MRNKPTSAALLFFDICGLFIFLSRTFNILFLDRDKTAILQSAKFWRQKVKTKNTEQQQQKVTLKKELYGRKKGATILSIIKKTQHNGTALLC
jgi:hypothetical protein